MQDNTYNYYDGSEFVIVGKLNEMEKGPKYPTLDARVDGLTASGPTTFEASLIIRRFV